MLAEILSAVALAAGVVLWLAAIVAMVRGDKNDRARGWPAVGSRVPMPPPWPRHTYENNCFRFPPPPLERRTGGPLPQPWPCTQGGPLPAGRVASSREGKELFVPSDGRSLTVGAKPEGPPNRTARMGLNGFDISE
jgi:hypothetical protein